MPSAQPAKEKCTKLNDKNLPSLSLWNNCKVEIYLVEDWDIQRVEIDLGSLANNVSPSSCRIMWLIVNLIEYVEFKAVTCWFAIIIHFVITRAIKRWNIKSGLTSLQDFNMIPNYALKLTLLWNSYIISVARIYSGIFTLRYLQKTYWDKVNFSVWS